MILFRKNQSPDIGIDGNNNSMINGDGNTINNFYEATKRLTSTLAMVVNALGKKMPEEDSYVLVPDFSIEHKKDYNNVQAYRHVMDEFGPLTGKLALVYSTLDSEGTDVTFKTLSNIRLHYVKVRHAYMIAYPKMPMMDIVRAHADKIFGDVEQRLLTNVVSSANLSATIEDTQFAVQVVMIDAFIKCKILEHPTQNAIA